MAVPAPTTASARVLRGLAAAVVAYTVAAAAGAPPARARPDDEGPRGAAAAADTDGAAAAHAAASAPPDDAPVRYVLERIDVQGNTRSADHAIRGFVRLRPGDALDVDDPNLEATRWRLLGTGWFDEVRLRLRRGSRRGRVVLVVEVRERNTLVLRQVAFGASQGVTRTSDTTPQFEPYLGLSLADRNVFGQGLELGGSALVSGPQWGLRLQVADPFFLGGRFSADLAVFVNDAREFFGDDPLVGDLEAENVVLFYQRYGVRVGTGVDVSRFTRVTAGWQLELVDVQNRPPAASETVGDVIRPIDFDILDGRSALSFLRVGLRYERRDDPTLPTSGTLVDVRGDLGSRLFGGDYDFLRLQFLFRQWVRLPWANHHLRLGVYAGIAFGDTPFFLQFYLADLSDLIPSRVLEMNIDQRPAPNFFGTAIAEARIEDLAGRVDLEYGVPLLRTAGGTLRGIDAYFGAGLFALTDRRNVAVAIPGYEGAARVPIDLTFDLGLRFDTEIGVLQLGLSTVLGFFDP